MGSHDAYGKRVMQRAAGSECYLSGEALAVPYVEGDQPAQIDCVVGKNIAVEIESRESKQVRAAILDLLSHPYKKKLLILIPANMWDPEGTRRQAEAIFRRFVSSRRFRVVVLAKKSAKGRFTADVRTVRQALQQLGWRGRRGGRHRGGIVG